MKSNTRIDIIRKCLFKIMLHFVLFSLVITGAACSHINTETLEANDVNGVQNKLGQLLYINVDGFGYQGDYAVNSVFFETLSDLNIGGVLVHYNSFDPEKIRNTNIKLQSLSRLPLFIGIDYVEVENNNIVNVQERKAAVNRKLFGNGFAGGFIKKYDSLDLEKYIEKAEEHALELSALGINHVLGPTVDNSAKSTKVVEKATIYINIHQKYNIVTTPKHFPYLPLDYDLHNETHASNFDPDEVKKKILPFIEVKNNIYILMTTHISNSYFDNGTIATFSSEWIRWLRNEMAYDKLIMSDGLFMVTHYQNYKNKENCIRCEVLSDGFTNHGISCFALRAILAGHDMIILEGSLKQTQQVYKDLLVFALREDDYGKIFRDRIQESYSRIVKIKKKILS